MDITLEPSWKNALSEYIHSNEFAATANMARDAYLQECVFPTPSQVFTAFNLCPFDEVRVVILGQDPYHGAGQAIGLSFSVRAGVAQPPSLKNIFKEIATDTGRASICAHDGDLSPWACQGVLLLNSVLTVEESRPGSHAHIGWQAFTDEVIKQVSSQKEQVVFVLWGKYAQTKLPLIDTTKHLVLQAPHPSPLSAHRGFFGSRPFSQTNAYLQKNNKTKITW